MELDFNNITQKDIDNHQAQGSGYMYKYLADGIVIVDALLRRGINSYLGVELSDIKLADVLKNRCHFYDQPSKRKSWYEIDGYKILEVTVDGIVTNYKLFSKDNS